MLLLREKYVVITRKDLVLTRKICRFNEKRSRYYEKICRFNEKRSRYYEKRSRYYEKRSRYNDIIEWKKYYMDGSITSLYQGKRARSSKIAKQYIAITNQKRKNEEKNKLNEN